MTKIWRKSVSETDHTQAKIISDEWFESGISVFDCAPLQGPFPDVVLQVRSGYPPNDFFEPGTLFTVSDRLKSVLCEFNIHAEFFPVRIIYKCKEYFEQTFYFCNILNCVDCFDLSQGEYTFEARSGDVKDIRKLALNEEKILGHDLFRIAKGGEYIVCVSDRVATGIMEARLTGMRFVAPEEWTFC